MKHVLFFIAEKNFRDEEYFEPKQILEDAGIICDCTSTNDDSAESKSGLIVMPTVSLNNVDVKDYEAFILVGGPGALKMGEDFRVKNIIIDAYNRKKLICAICVAPVILAKYGLVDGREISAWPTTKEEIEKSGAIYMSDEVIVDDSEEDNVIITGNGPDASISFGNAIKEKLI